MLRPGQGGDCLLLCRVKTNGNPRVEYGVVAADVCLESQRPGDPVFDPDHPRRGESTDVLRHIITAQERRAGREGAGGHALSQLHPHRRVSDDPGLGDPLFDLPTNVGCVPRRPLRTQPRQHKVLVLKTDNKTFFIDASAEFVRQGNKNKLTDTNQRRILDAFTARQDVAHFAKLVDNADLEANAYNIAVSSYVKAEDTRVAVNITQLNAEIARIVARQSELRTEIDAIVGELEGGLR